jgi:tRNA dimethylallyltransferase
LTEPESPFGPAPLRFLVGPTASGKSALALELAEALAAEVLALDSMQVYRGMDVGTAKPSAAERARVPHALLDLVEPSERYDVSRYLADARAALAAAEGRGRRALFVGGTGLYLKALAEGLFGGPAPDPALRGALEERARREGSPALHAELATRDPASAARLHPNDRKRVVRALEVLEQTGRPLSAWQHQWGGPESARPALRLVGLFPQEEQHAARIATRVRAMLEGGWVEEARAIRDGCGFGPTAIQALGYADVLELADGRLTRPECEARVIQKTRRFVRRQRTWFRSFPAILWLDPRAPDTLARARAELLR